MSSTAIFSPSPFRVTSETSGSTEIELNRLYAKVIFLQRWDEKKEFFEFLQILFPVRKHLLEKFLQGKSYYKRRIVRIEIRRSRYCELKGSVSRNSFAVIRLEFWHSLWGQFVPG